MKRINWKRFLVLITFLVLIISMTTIANAGYDYQEANVIDMGVVTCTGLSLRTAPDTRAKKIATLSNGTLIPITGETGDFYIVNIESIEKVKGDGLGYVLKRYVNTNPYYITLQKTVEIWSAPWNNAVAVGQKVKGAKFLVVDENNEWYSVQLNEGKAGVGFIRKADLGYYTYNYWYEGRWISSNHAIATKKLSVLGRANDTNFVIGTVKKDEIVKKLGTVTNGYQPIEYNGYMAFVPVNYLIDIYGVEE